MNVVDPSLPGADLIMRGLRDLEAGQVSEEALLISAAEPRLRSIGIEFTPAAVEMPLHRVYELLGSDHGDDAHSRYNALVARIVSFARAAERASTG